MEKLRYLISFFLKVSFAFFLFAFVWWVVSIFVPDLSIRVLFSSKTSSSTDEGWLPSPRKYSSLFGRKGVVPDANTNVYVPGAPYDGSGNVYTPAAPYNGYGLSNDQYKYSSYNYVTYSADSKNMVTTSGDGRVVGGAVPVQAPALTGNRVLSVRNLSIYEGGHVYTGLSFIGEAKSSMFREGKFPIVVIDQTGRVVGVSAAVATTQWAVPGWVRFQTKINYVLPRDVPCTMIFEEALTQTERNVRMPLRVPIQVRCN